MGNGAVLQTKNYRLQSRELANARRHIKFFLGRDPLSAQEVWDCAESLGTEILKKLLRSNEFQSEIWLPILLVGQPASDRFRGVPSKSIITWLAESFSLEERTKEFISDLTNWRDLLSAVWSDQQFLNCVRAGGHSLKSIERFQQALRTESGARPVGAIPKFTPPHVPIPNCNLLVARNKNQNHSDSPKQIDLTQRIGETHNLAEVKAYVARYDPQIIIPANIVGQFMIDIDIEFVSGIEEADVSYLQIFLDFGEGWKESESCTIEIIDHRVSTTLWLDADQTVRRIRIDPSVYASVFIVTKLNLTEL